MMPRQEIPSEIPGIYELLGSSPLLEKAFTLGKQAHEGKFRKSGEPYFSHCIATAQALLDWGIRDEPLLAAAFLHDAVEDTQLTLDEIKHYFEEEIAFLVDGVTKFKSDSDQFGDKETLKKIVSLTYMDPRVALIKLADRLHNLSTITSLPAEKQRQKAEETLNVYSRLAESLGIWVLKTQLEDLAFEILDPQSFKQVKTEIDHDLRLSDEFVTYVKTNLERLLMENGIEGSIEARKSGYLSLKKKRQHAALAGKSVPESFKDINDVVSFRVRLRCQRNCYSFLDIVHQEYGPMVDFERYDEFIGYNRRMNGYEAIQTTLNFVQEGAVEIAIATNMMEEFNNWGVIRLIAGGEKDLQKYALKMIFTPTGEVRFLPREATGIDLAYSLNPRLGADAVQLLVDGKRMPLSAVVPNASVVEILVGEPRRAPDASLVRYCLPSTRRIIEEQLKQQERDRMIERGRKALEDLLANRGLLDLGDITKTIRPTLYLFGCQGVDDLYFKIGGGYLPLDLFSDELNRRGITKEKLGVSGVEIEGQDQPGILRDLSLWISELGGNILNVGAIRSDNDCFHLHLSLKGIGINGEKILEKKLSADNRFRSWRIV